MNFLMTVSLFENLSEYELQKICDCLKSETFKEKDYVIREGEVGERFYLVMQGNLKATKWNPNTKETENVFFYSEGMYFGELALLSD